MRCVTSLNQQIESTVPQRRTAEVHGHWMIFRRVDLKLYSRENQKIDSNATSSTTSPSIMFCSLLKKSRGAVASSESKYRMRYPNRY